MMNWYLEIRARLPQKYKVLDFRNQSQLTSRVLLEKHGELTFQTKNGDV